jgi:hypothetical protein
MHHRFLIFASSALAVLPFPAQALKCMPPVIDQAVVNNAALIFEGVAIRQQTQSFGLNGAVTSQKKSHVFAITKMWKGDPDIQVVGLENNILWGQDYDMGTPYLVVANVENGTFVIPACSYTRPVTDAAEGLNFLEHTSLQEITPATGE